ncbi:MAG TPA: hypothetical protein VE684_00720 [Crenalkalicoccus sp.]|nr:hypothetical protein [Crenalkalicoccus sp.]
MRCLSPPWYAMLPPRSRAARGDLPHGDRLRPGPFTNNPRKQPGESADKLCELCEYAQGVSFIQGSGGAFWQIAKFVSNQAGGACVPPVPTSHAPVVGAPADATAFGADDASPAHAALHDRLLPCPTRTMTLARAASR